MWKLRRGIQWLVFLKYPFQRVWSSLLDWNIFHLRIFQFTKMFRSMILIVIQKELLFLVKNFFFGNCILHTGNCPIFCLKKKKSQWKNTDIQCLIGWAAENKKYSACSTLEDSKLPDFPWKQCFEHEMQISRPVNVTRLETLGASLWNTTWFKTRQSFPFSKKLWSFYFSVKTDGRAFWSERKCPREGHV